MNVRRHAGTVHGVWRPYFHEPCKNSIQSLQTAALSVRVAITSPLWNSFLRKLCGRRELSKGREPSISFQSDVKFIGI
jgi:hypothetical protein